MTTAQLSNPENGVPCRNAVVEAEISLIDLWLILVRRKAFFLIVAILALVLGAGYASVAPKKYTFSTVIAIGQRYGDDGTPLLTESPEQLKNEIEYVDLPMTIAAYKKVHPDFTGDFPFRVTVPRGSNIVVLSAKGPTSTEPVYRTLVKSVTDSVISRLGKFEEVGQSMLNAQRAAIESQISQAETRIQWLENYQYRLARMEIIVKDEVRSTKRFLEGPAVRGMKRDAPGDTAGRFFAASQYWSAQQRLARLDAELNVYIPGERESAEAQFKALRKQLAALHSQLDVLQAKSVNLQKTRIIAQPPEKAGPSKRLIMVLSFVLATMLGVFAAFVAEFVINARAQIGVGAE